MSRSIALAAAIVLVCLIVLSSCVFRPFAESKPQPPSPLPGYESLDKFPFQEAWYGQYFREDKVGFSHFKVQREGAQFLVRNESLMILKVPKKTDEIEVKETVTVRPDLTLLGFDSTVSINGKQLHVVGKASERQLVVDIEGDGKKVRREVPIEGPVYHSTTSSLIPALRGLHDGRSYKFAVFNVEKQRLDEVEQQVFLVRGDPGPSGAVWKVKNTFGKVVVYSWLDKTGLTVLEQALDGLLTSLLEDKATAEEILKKRSKPSDVVALQVGSPTSLFAGPPRP